MTLRTARGIPADPSNVLVASARAQRASRQATVGVQYPAQRAAPWPITRQGRIERRLAAIVAADVAGLRPADGCGRRGNTICQKPMEQFMRLTSSAFADGAMIPRRFTCDGQNLSPPLAWADVPDGARSQIPYATEQGIFLA